MTHIIDQKYIDERFPTLSTMTYLNTASTGINPQQAISAMTLFLKNSSDAIGTFEDTMNLFRDVREDLARLLGGESSQYAFVPSTSGGVNSFGHSIHYPKGSNIVICDLEFPANYVPWQNISRKHGPELRVVKSEDGAVTLDQFTEKIDDETRVVSVSHTQFGTGFRTDLKALATVAHKHGAYLSTDIIQSAGWADLDLGKDDVDFATAQAAKWLVGPIGAGFVYVSKRVMDALEPMFLGWWGIKNPEDFSYSMREPLDDAQKFQVGSPAVIAYVGFHESLRVLLENSNRTRERAAMDNADYLRKRLSEEGVECYDFGVRNNSPIVSCAPPNAEELNKKLMEMRILCSVRNGRLRVSPHFYNSRIEIERLIDAMR